MVNGFKKGSPFGPGGLPAWWFFLLPFLALVWKAPSLTTFLLSPAHNIQIAYGKQALLGKVPYLDLIHFYGPLQIYTSAFGLWLSDTVIPEILICALGYAASLYLIFHLVEKESTWFHGAAAALAGYAFLSRFYKWYYWLFPLLALYFFRRFLHERRSREDGWLLAAGLAGGVGALYRVDLGLASLAFFSLALGALSLRPFRFSVWLWRMAVFLVGFVSPLLLWALILIAQGGAEAWHLYWKGILDGSTGVVKHMSLPFPVFEPTAPFSTESALALAYYSFLIIYAGCLVQGVKMAWAGGEEKRGWFLAAVGLMGAGIFPQALHRSDIAHLLQVLPPFLVGAGLLIPHLWHPVPASPRMQKAARGVAVVFLAGLLTAGWNLKQFGGSDWASLISDPVHRYPGLARGLPAGGAYPAPRLDREIRQRTKPGDPILVLPWRLAGPLYFFSDRTLSGILLELDNRMYTRPFWRQKNLEAIRTDPPALVVVDEMFFHPPEKNDWLKFRPELFRYIQRHYPRTAATVDRYVLLEPEGPGVT